MGTAKLTLDLNADLGEGEPESVLSALMAVVSSVNIACGGHAGNAATMARIVQLAVDRSVNIGAHPGFPNRSDFGRTESAISPDELRLLLLHQVGALATVAAKHNTPLHHIKLHGALYHATESKPPLADAYLEFIRDFFPNTIAFAFAGGTVCKRAKGFGVEAWGEAFIERGYGADGLLVPRGLPGAILASSKEIEWRVRHLAKDSSVLDVEGKIRKIPARTLCIHADTPNADRIARVAKRILTDLAAE